MNEELQTAKGIEVGEIVHDVFNEGLRFIIMRGPCSWCGYIGIPKDHPLAGFDYNSLSFIPSHGGLTFSGVGNKSFPKSFFWYGWDYGHLGDRIHYEKYLGDTDRDEHDWTVREVIEDSRETIYGFKTLMKLAESIYENTKNQKKVVKKQQTNGKV